VKYFVKRRVIYLDNRQMEFRYLERSPEYMKRVLFCREIWISMNIFISYKGTWIAYIGYMSYLQEQLRKRKDEEERQEMLSRSLRGSKKLQALESHATSLSGQENLAYAQDEVTTSISRVTHVTPNAVQEVEEPPRPLSK